MHKHGKGTEVSAAENAEVVSEHARERPQNTMLRGGAAGEEQPHKLQRLQLHVLPFGSHS